ncbi:hypothetical protein B0H66DRAFT_576763 [Apodospora peruviana]|uniref:MINDY deubiquitinase domain-containing protein n=1 Tax=Apodospora peruviana TaxID=516989 RepID=A0AAE0HX77_9PEZI|nr:hypothetical protein B0H66DRAFT_576763 [Apodospora peruviana]
MVTRKPLPGNAAVPSAVPPLIQIQSPTPTTPRVRPEPWETFDDEDQDESEDKVWGDQPHSRQQDVYGHKKPPPHVAPDHVPTALRPGASTSPSYAGLEEEDNVWVESAESPDDGSKSDIDRVPSVLRPGSGGQRKQVDKVDENEADNDFVRVPTVLRPGGGAARPETNPFKRKLSAGAIQPGSTDATPATTLPVPTVPVDAFSQLDIAEQSTNPWQPALPINREAVAIPPIPGMSEQDVGNDAWNSAKPSRQATPGPGSNSPALISIPSEAGSAGWEEEPRKSSLPPPLVPAPDQEVLQDSHAWDDLGTVNKGKTPAQAIPLPTGGSTGSGDDWNLIDVEAPPGPPPKQSAWGSSGNAPVAPPKDVPAQGPPLPPRQSTEEPPPQPPRHIKKINWYDVTAPQNPRTSPILVQNANGPCPLVALTNTALVETLRSRERITLGLLLDAVFDELMSDRRTSPDRDLPDVTELYEFLKGLHTGMNVNPRFVPTPEAINVLKRTSLTHVHPTDRTNLIPGTFEATKEMALYATDDAASYEDAQNLLFREEELEDKLESPRHQGLTAEEQQIYQDILTIKSFLSISATQLTSYGLDVIRQSMKPGSVAILFRNDHFSTLYRHPQTLELLTLVTDAGYASHDEVVWESLVDVNGDFRLRQSSGSQPASYAAAAGGSSNDGDWTTAQRQQAPPENPPTSPTHEQEDRDLALALQLQEEEDERHRAEQERRRRERQTTGNANSGRGGARNSQVSTATGPAAPARRSSNTVNSVPVTTTSSRGGRGGATAAAGRGTTGAHSSAQTVRSLIPPVVRPRTNRAADDGLDDAPPSYEQAAKATPYVPPAGHPSHPASSPTSSTEGNHPMAAGLASGPPNANTAVSSSSTVGGAGGLQTENHTVRDSLGATETAREHLIKMTVGLVNNWYPLSRDNYNIVLSIWKWFPVAAQLQWVTSWYGMGKTSTASRFNLPGRIGWFTMEAPGFFSLLYTMNTLPNQNGISSLPWQNKVLGALFVIHYSYRAILFPIIQPSMAPLHILIWLFALCFQVINGSCIGAWLGAYGPTTPAQWDATVPVWQFSFGIALFYVGLAANYYHDDELREIRRREMARQERVAKQSGQPPKTIDKHYEIPQAVDRVAGLLHGGWLGVLACEVLSAERGDFDAAARCEWEEVVCGQVWGGEDQEEVGCYSWCVVNTLVTIRWCQFVCVRIVEG